MAEEALRIRVDKNVYQQTLSSLDTQLGNLNSHRENLERQIERLKSGNVFSGSDVQAAIKKAEAALETVKDAISRVRGYRVTINQQLENVQTAGDRLATDMANIDLPNMFI